MLPETASSNLDDYLPPNDPKLTYKDLLHGYGKWWQAQPSLTPYKRFYDVDSEPHYLIVWEGYTGFYDFYGDFADDHAFYNRVVKGYMIHFHTRLSNGMLSVRVFSGMTEKPDYERTYQTPAAMRASMIAEWPQIAPGLGEQGEKLKRFIETNVDKIIARFNEAAQVWQDAGKDWRKKRYSLAYHSRDQIYLCLWIGTGAAAEKAIRRPPASDESGSPFFDRKSMTAYAVFHISFLRVPVRFELELLQWPMPSNEPIRYRQLTPRDKSVTTFAELDTLLSNAISNLAL